MTTHDVPLVVRVEDPVGDYRPVDLPLDLYDSLPDAWKDPDEGSPHWISMIASRDRYGREVELERHVRTLTQTIDELRLDKLEFEHSIKHVLATYGITLQPDDTELAGLQTLDSDVTDILQLATNMSFVLAKIRQMR